MPANAPAPTQPESSVTQSHAFIQKQQLEEQRRAAFNRWLLFLRDKRTPAEQERLECFYTALKSAISGQLNAYKCLASGEIQQSASWETSIFEMLASQIPYAGNVLIYAQIHVGQWKTANDSFESSQFSNALANSASVMVALPDTSITNYTISYYRRQEVC